MEILSEGPKNVIEDINVIGTKKHSREEILDFLGLKTGPL